MPRHPTPTHLRLLQGNPQRRPINKNEPKPEIPATVPEPPPFVVGYGLDEWHRLAPGLHAMGLLTVVDIMPLAGYCVAYLRWRDAEEALDRMRSKDPLMNGLIIKVSSNGGGPATNPLVNIARKALLDMIRIAGEFGFTPAARSRIDAGVGGEAAPSKFGDLLA